MNTTTAQTLSDKALNAAAFEAIATHDARTYMVVSAEQRQRQRRRRAR